MSDKDNDSRLEQEAKQTQSRRRKPPRLTREERDKLAQREVEALYEKTKRLLAHSEEVDETTPLDELSVIDIHAPDVALAGQKALRGAPLDALDEEYRKVKSNIPALTEHHEVLEGDVEVKQVARVKDNSVILDTVVGWVVYIILIFAIYLFWTGHNAPGGGFIAGLMTAAVVVLMYVAFGSKFIRNTMKFDFKYLIAVGLTFSLGCGLGGLLFGDPFLTHTFGEFHLGALGDIELATAAIFDLGVYLTVTGGCVTIITSIGESGSRRSIIPVAEDARRPETGDPELDR